MSGTNEHDIVVFSELVAEHRSRVFGYVYAMLHNMSDAEDVYQQTTVLMRQKFDEFQVGTDFGSWALKIAYYNIKNFQRSQGRKHLFFSEAVMEKVADNYRALDQQRSAERVEALIDCVSRLPRKHQQLLKWRYADNMPIKQLAEHEGKSQAAVSMLLSRLRKALYRCINSRSAAG